MVGDGEYVEADQMKLLLIAASIAALALLPSVWSAQQCASVAQGEFYCTPPTLGFNGASDWTTLVHSQTASSTSFFFVVGLTYWHVSNWIGMGETVR
jgi:hypothetical protein